MASCLGLFVEDNLIKYAKVSKENENIKIENYGVKFYEQDLEKNINQIVDETFSYKTPISINMKNEKYTNTEIFGLLSETDRKKSIKTEFDYFCNDTGKNRLTMEYKTVISNGLDDEDKKNVLFVYSEKGNIAERIQLLDSYKIASLPPVSLAIQELQNSNIGNTLVVNIEDRTEITTLVNNVPVKVDIIESGMGEILKQISQRENSISKAYELCKNTTLYTASSQNLKTDNGDYLEIIVPSLYKIIEEVKKVIEKNNINIQKIYLTGTAIVINNIDLYFQENFMNYKCEILTPYFIDKTNLRLNIKDYIEVNSAIALAILYLNKNHKSLSFVNKSEIWEKVSEVLYSDVGHSSKKIKNKKEKTTSQTFKINIKVIGFLRFAYSMFILLIAYIIAALLIGKMINDKINMAEKITEDTKTKISEVVKTTNLIKSRTESYQKVLEQLKEADDKVTQANKTKNVIPNLLNQLMFAIPKEAQILSIENTEDKHITIIVQANEYQYLGYFKSEIQNRAILTNVTSTSGTRDKNDMIQITIEGDLPY